MEGVGEALNVGEIVGLKLKVGLTLKVGEMVKLGVWVGETLNVGEMEKVGEIVGEGVGVGVGVGEFAEAKVTKSTKPASSPKEVLESLR
jgi:hypothetical protein